MNPSHMWSAFVCLSCVLVVTSHPYSSDKQNVLQVQERSGPSGGCDGEESSKEPLRNCKNLAPVPFIQSKNKVIENKVDSTSSQPGKVVFRDGFETGKLCVDKINVCEKDNTWSRKALEIADSSTAEIVKDPAGSGKNVVKFTVPDDGESFRAEVQRNQFNWGHYSYSVSHYIPSTWPLYDSGTVVAQWHGYNINDVSMHPPISLNIFGKQNPQWQLQMFRLKPLSSPQDKPETELKDCGVLDVPVTFDQWHNWNFDIKWSNQSTEGLIVLKHNGKEVARKCGDNNYHQQWTPYFQMGIYRSDWRKTSPNRPAIEGKPIVVYHKDVEIKDLN